MNTNKLELLEQFDFSSLLDNSYNFINVPELYVIQLVVYIS
jgi:hypothetical protein